MFPTSTWPESGVHVWSFVSGGISECHRDRRGRLGNSTPKWTATDITQVLYEVPYAGVSHLLECSALGNAGVVLRDVVLREKSVEIGPAASAGRRVAIHVDLRQRYKGSLSGRSR